MAISRAVFAIPAGGTVIAGGEIVSKECGCRVYIGRRRDTREAATATAICAASHKPMMERFNKALIDSLDNPTTRPLAEVCEEILQGLEP